MEYRVEARRTLTQRAEQVEDVLRQQSEAADTEARRARVLAERCAELEQTLAAADSQRAGLHADVQRMMGEIAALRNDNADRAALVRQTSELTGRIGTLEQQLAERHSQATQAEQRQAALAAELDAARQEDARGRATAAQQQATLQALLDRAKIRVVPLPVRSPSHRGSALVLDLLIAAALTPDRKSTRLNSSHRT